MSSTRARLRSPGLRDAMAPDAARRRAMDGAAPSDLTLQLGVLPDTSEILANAGPFGTQVGFGAVAGYCAGVALRVAGTAGLALAGAGFVALQGLQYKGYVAVDWQKVERELRDTVRDISGASSEAASRRAMDEMADAIKFGLPGAGGFSLGVAYGVGGVLGRAAAMGTLWTLGPTLGVSHLYQVSDAFRDQVSARSPFLAEALERALAEARKNALAAMEDSRDAAFGGLAGDAAWRASLRDADSLRKLRKLEREAKPSWFSRDGNDRKAAAKLDAVRAKRRALVAETERSDASR